MADELFHVQLHKSEKSGSSSKFVKVSPKTYASDVTVVNGSSQPDLVGVENAQEVVNKLRHLAFEDDIDIDDYSI